MTNYETFTCVCNKERMRIWDDGIATHIEIDFINQKYTLWERLTGKARIDRTKKPVDVVLVGKERQNFLDIRECIANPIIVQRVPRVTTGGYPFFESPVKRSHHKKKPAKKTKA